MKNFDHFGVRRRFFPDFNYNAVWNNLVTLRSNLGEVMALPPEYSEFYDVSLGTVCTTGKCPFCYVAANPNGRFYEDICETWIKWMDTYKSQKSNGVLMTEKPFQVAIGSEGEPLEHPEICEFLETVYNTGVVPNYTTNGVILSSYDNPRSEHYEKARRIIEATRKFVGGVAVSFGNPALRRRAYDAVEVLLRYGDCHVNIHHIISDKESVDNFVKVWKEYGDEIKYHVLLPLMPKGRSSSGIEEGVFEYLEEQINKYQMKNVAFGAHFVGNLKSSKIPTWLYEPESYSKNVLLKKNRVEITPSSFDLNPVKVIELSE